MFTTWLLFIISISTHAGFKHDYYIVNWEFMQLKYSNPEFLDDTWLRSVKVNRTFKAFTLHFKLKKDLDGDKFKTNLVANKILDNSPKLKIVNFDYKICEALRTNLFGLRVALQSNITQCPVKKGYYHLKNFYMDATQFPPFIPEGRYRLENTFIYESKKIGRLDAYAEVVYKIKY